jgi:pyruvate/2-oxoglutarate dehydrogenase complex dihydrolipoamide dehydrogenase (E3) component
MSMARDGVETRLSATVVGARLEGHTKWLDLVSDDARYSIPVDEILLSAGRTPNVEELGLESAGIAFEALTGIEVDAYLRTTNVDVYAAGDVCKAHHFTHIATACAQLAVRNAFGAQLEHPGHLMGPWCTYCDPEIAHIGMRQLATILHTYPTQSDAIRMAALAFMNDQPISR